MQASGDTATGRGVARCPVPKGNSRGKQRASQDLFAWGTNSVEGLTRTVLSTSATEEEEVGSSEEKEEVEDDGDEPPAGSGRYVEATLTVAAMVKSSLEGMVDAFPLESFTAGSMSTASEDGKKSLAGNL
jgi:hypothetical protein